MKDFFVSYNKADRTWAEWIAWRLEAAGYTVVIQAWDFRPGGNFVLDMQNAAADTERTIAVLSPDYLTALYTQPEWAAAFGKDPTGEKKSLVPVRVRECEITGLLHPIVYIDLFNLDESAAEQALLNGVKRDRAKPKQKPSFPPTASRAVAGKPKFPGALPDIWNIPFLRNPNFTGREEMLSDLRASLLAGQTAALVQAITGLGGVGKTQLALEYAYRNGATYDAVWWVRSEDPLTLAGDFANLAVRLDLPEKDAPQQQVIVAAVKEWLRLNSGWLLIFDNAEDVRLVRGYIPPGHTGHIIITSRNPQWKNIASPLTVKPLPVAEAIDLLCNRTSQQDSVTAEKLAETLGCLPLALEQAGAYIEACGCSLEHYLDLFEKRQYEMMQEGEPSAESPATVATTWNLSFQNVEKEKAAAAELLRLCAFFAPDDIPLKMLVDGAGELPESLSATVQDAFLLDKAVRALRRYSLIEVENETLSVHRLMQSVIRHSLSEEAFKQWAGIAVHIVNAAFPSDSDDVRTWPSCLPLLPHASVVLSYAEDIRFASNEMARLLNQVGIYLQNRAEYEQAKRMLERALAINEATFGPNHPSVAIRLNNLGLVLKTQGDFNGAKALYERALAIDEAAFGLDHPDVAIDANNLGSVLQTQGDLDGAKPLFERALAIGEAAIGPDHPQVATCANNLGMVLQAQGDFNGAKALYERALAIDEAAFGLDHPDVAIDAHNLGMVLKDQGDLDGAKPLLERALRIFREFLGDDHPNTKTVQNNLRILEQKITNTQP